MSGQIRAMAVRQAAPRRHSSGFSLVEILVVVLLFSIGLLGLVGLQARATQYSVGAEDTSRAALLAADLASLMWAGRSVEIDEDALKAWRERVADPQRDGLPGGEADVSIDGNTAELIITWSPPGAPDGTLHRYTTQVQVIP